jgi:hypothetical protein
MGTDAVNIYGWLICKVTVLQRTIRLFVCVAYTSYLSLRVCMCLFPVEVKGAVDFELIEKSLPCIIKMYYR